MDSSDMKEKALALPDKAKSIHIIDSLSYTRAADFLKGVKALRSEVAAAFDPIIKSAHDAHKTALAQKKAADTPLDDAERIVKGEMARYNTEQERIRREEEARLAAEARKLEEERRRKEAEALEAERKRIEAEQAEKEEDWMSDLEAAVATGKYAEANDSIQASIASSRAAQEDLGRIAAKEELLKNEPIAIAPIQIQKNTPKIEGVSCAEVWRFEIVNADLIPREYMTPDLVKIGRDARDLKDKAKIAGVRVFSEAVIRSGR